MTREAIHAPPWLRVIGLAAFLVAYGNEASQFVGGATPSDPRPGLALALLLTCLLALYAHSAGIDGAAIGLTRRNLPGSAAAGLLIALAAGAVALLVLRYPPLVGGPVTYAPVATLPRTVLLWRIFIWMPLDTAIPEEFAFRGVLLGELRRISAPTTATLASAAAFVLWHLSVLVRTLAATNMAHDAVPLPLGLVGSFAAVFAGGLLFAGLRLATHNLAASAVAHWAFNALLLLGLAS